MKIEKMFEEFEKVRNNFKRDYRGKCILRIKTYVKDNEGNLKEKINHIICEENYQRIIDQKVVNMLMYI